MVKRGFETKLVYATAIFVYSFHHRFVWARAFIMGKVENRVQKARKHSFGNLLLYHCTGFMKIHYVVDYHCAGLNGFWNWNCIKLIVRRYNGCTRTRGARTVNFYLVPFFYSFLFFIWDTRNRSEARVIGFDVAKKLNGALQSQRNEMFFIRPVIRVPGKAKGERGARINHAQYGRTM